MTLTAFSVDTERARRAGATFYSVASSKQTNDDYVQRARVFKALADPHRLRILDLLSEEGTLCGTELAERVGISLALLSHHWKILIDAGLISREQRGQTKYCTIECSRLQEALAPWPDPPSEAVQAKMVAKRAAQKQPAKATSKKRA